MVFPGEGPPNQIGLLHPAVSSTTLRMPGTSPLVRSRKRSRRFSSNSGGVSPWVRYSGNSATLWYTFYNFCRIHKSLRVTPAMVAGIGYHAWSLRELLEAA